MCQYFMWLQTKGEHYFACLELHVSTDGQRKIPLRFHQYLCVYRLRKVNPFLSSNAVYSVAIRYTSPGYHHPSILLHSFKHCRYSTTLPSCCHDSTAFFQKHHRFISNLLGRASQGGLYPVLVVCKLSRTGHPRIIKTNLRAAKLR